MCSRLPGPGAGVGIIGLHAQGMLLLLAEPQIEFEMSNREPSCLCCERQGLAGRFPPCRPLWTRGGGWGDSPKPAPGVTGKPAPLAMMGGRAGMADTQQRRKEIISMKHLEEANS